MTLRASQVRKSRGWLQPFDPHTVDGSEIRNKPPPGMYKTQRK